MPVTVGDMQSIGVAGWWITSGSTPSAPTLAVVNVGDGDSVTATITGDAGVTNLLLYRKPGDAL